MSEIKICVSTHDYDTTDINLSRNGTKLKVSLGDKKAEIDIAEFVPATMADRFLADASYDKKKKELVLITRKEGEEEKEIRVPISHIFQVEIEEVLTKEKDGLYTGVVVNVNTETDQAQFEPMALGRIKGTDWYVFKFDNQAINDWVLKRDAPKPELKVFDPNATTTDNGAEVFSWKNLFSRRVIDICAVGVTVNGDAISFLDFARSETFQQDTLPEALIVYSEQYSDSWTFTAVQENGVVKHYAPPAELPFVYEKKAVGGIEFRLDAVIKGERHKMTTGSHVVNTPQCAEIEDNEE